MEFFEKFSKIPPKFTFPFVIARERKILMVAIQTSTMKMKKKLKGPKTIT